MTSEPFSLLKTQQRELASNQVLIVFPLLVSQQVESFCGDQGASEHLSLSLS
eukprot:c14807_g2_i1 orf=1-153(-)